MSNLIYTHFTTTIGKIYLLSDGKYLLQLDFSKNSAYISATSVRDHTIFIEAEKQLEEYLKGLRHKFDLPLDAKGTEFQKLAWKTLINIPFGSVLSYGAQALKMKKPKAQRAAGSANGKNPIPIIIPCHRIITSDFKLGGYSGDIKLKEKLLKIEGHSFKNGRLII